MQQLKDQINANIERIFTFPTEKLYQQGINKQSWNGYTDGELKKYVEGVLSILKKIQKDNSTLNNVGNSNINTLNSYIQNFLNSLQNSGIQSIPLEQITSHHHDSLNWIENINTHLRSSGLYNEVSISTSQIRKANEEFLSIQKFLDETNKNKSTYEQALSSLQGLLDKQGELNSAVLNGQANAFKERADNYKTHNFIGKNKYSGGLKFWMWGIWKENINGLWIWLFLGLIFSIITGAITFFNIISHGNEPTTAGQAILRIASIIVPSYLTVFSFSQYLYGKKMHESYMFKFASLQTMNSLISANSDLKEKILSRGLDVLFSEPNSKPIDASKEDKQIISELLSMIKGQLK